LVEHLLIQRMPKPIAPAAGAIRPDRQSGVHDEVLLRRQPVTDRLDVGHGPLGPRGHRHHRKVFAHHTRRFDYLLHLPSPPPVPRPPPRRGNIPHNPRAPPPAAAPCRHVHCPPWRPSSPCCTRCSTRCTMNSALPSVRSYTNAASAAAPGPPSRPATYAATAA